MKRQPISDYVWLGGVIEFLKNVQAGRVLGTQDQRYVLGCLEGYFSYLDSLALRVTTAASRSLSEAGKCTAFERPTAAAFHLMRATEAMLRKYYCAVVRRSRRTLMWGPMVRHLRERRDSSRHGPVLEQLDHIRVSFRNPTQHPEMRYTMDEVQDLWGVCTDVLSRMARQLPS